jgi:hypothetical protein
MVGTHQPHTGQKMLEHKPYFSHKSITEAPVAFIPTSKLEEKVPLQHWKTGHVGIAECRGTHL